VNSDHQPKMLLYGFQKTCNIVQHTHHYGTFMAFLFLGHFHCMEKISISQWKKDHHLEGHQSRRTSFGT